jgi:uncharacterized protein YjbJ (UPF0337 family)
MGRIEDAKDKAIGKVMGTAGRMAEDKKLEFTGKFQTATAQMKDKLYDVKEDIVQEANDLKDKAESKLKKNV